MAIAVNTWDNLEFVDNRETADPIFNALFTINVSGYDDQCKSTVQTRCATQVHQFVTQNYTKMCQLSFFSYLPWTLCLHITNNLYIKRQKVPFHHFPHSNIIILTIRNHPLNASKCKKTGRKSKLFSSKCLECKKKCDANVICPEKSSQCYNKQLQ